MEGGIRHRVDYDTACDRINHLPRQLVIATATLNDIVYILTIAQVNVKLDCRIVPGIP